MGDAGARGNASVPTRDTHSSPRTPGVGRKQALHMQKKPIRPDDPEALS